MYIYFLLITGASSNSEAHEAAYQTFANPSKAVRIDVFERYMLALAQSKQCKEEVLDKVWLDAQKVTKVAHEKIRQTLVLTLATLINKSTNIELKSKVIKWIVGSMLNCKKPECHQHFLRALKTIHSVSTIPILLKMVESAETNQKTALLALEVLSKYEPELLQTKIKNFDQHLLTLAKDPSKEMSLKSVAIGQSYFCFKISLLDGTLL